MKTFFFSLALGFLLTNAHAQIDIEEVKAILATKYFNAFDDLYKKSAELELARSHIFREVIPKYREGVFFFPKHTKNRTKRVKLSIENFRVRLITYENNIIFYELSEERYRENYDFYFTLEKYKDEKAFLLFKKEFKSLFQTEMNEKELFVTNFAYGTNCGYDGMPPKGEFQKQQFVARKDKNALIIWLKSTNTEKQLYALSGLYELKKSGCQFSPEEKHLIKIVRNKKGKIFYCTGCTYFLEDIKFITEKFKF